MLILVVGPSGAGKDTLLEGARKALPHARFVRRVITRPAEAGGEEHEAVTEAEFLQRSFALQWCAHGLRYGIPADIADDLVLCRTVIANVSRGAIAEAASRFPAFVVEVTAPSEVLAARLSARAREAAADVAARLSRSVPMPDGISVARVMNDGSVEDGIARFVTAVTQATAAAPRS
ncbi:MAG: phosphonate metabolism protein/1,5-bisphosphokinase (PRPP-forming) PhnN [Rhodospirillales bacterium]